MSAFLAGVARDPGMLLALWERGLGQPPARRGAALLEKTGLTLGRQHAELAALHTSLFGRDIALVSQCPTCGTPAEFQGDSEAMSSPPPAAKGDHAVHHLALLDHEITFRLPTADDVAALAETPSPDAFAEQMLERCVIASARRDIAISPGELPDDVREALSRRMEALDPDASISFALECPECRTEWDAPLDLAQVVWQRIQAAAESLLTEVDALARAYGWTEDEVLRLTPTRRAAYLQQVQA